jgi:hypothetical protein
MPGLLLLAPLLIIAVSIPLILEKVPRNHWYGFRTPKTLSSDAVWYPANKIGGKYFVVAGLIQLAAMGIVWLISADAVLSYGGPVVAIPLLIAVVLWFVKLRHI